MSYFSFSFIKSIPARLELEEAQKENYCQKSTYQQHYHNGISNQESISTVLML